MKHVIQLFMILMAQSSPALAGIHHYRIPQVSPTEQGCLANEALVSGRFAQLTESKLLSHGCEQNPGKTYDIVIEYARSTAPNLVTTYNEFDTAHGLFVSAEECAANRDAQTEIFREATGLEPVVSYCYYDYLNEDADTSWTLRIEGFGSPRLSPYNLARRLFSSALTNPVDIQNTIVATLEAQGALAPMAHISVSRDMTSIYVGYYARKELALVEYHNGRFANQAHCESYRNVLQLIYGRAGGQSAAYFCSVSTLYQSVRAYSLGIVTEPLMTEVTSIKYPTFEACEGKRAETEQSWRTGLERDVIGSVCALEDTIIGPYGVIMRMFWIE